MKRQLIPKFIIYCLIALSALLSARAFANGEVSVSFGAEYTSGDYGTPSKTNIWYFPVTLRYETDVNSVSMTVPYLSVEGTGNVVASGGMSGMRRSTTRTDVRTETGFGDVVLAGSHKIAGTASSRVDLTGKMKLGTAEEKDNLGTGENDYAVQLDVEKNYNSNSVFGSVGYKILGDPPGTDYRNVFYGSIGLSHKLDAARTAGLAFDAQESVLSGASGESELSLFLSNKIDKKARLTTYVMKGFTHGSPDWGLGVALKLIR